MTGLKTNERPGTRAQVRYLRMSASKARVVLDLIRNKSVSDAHQILQFSERLAAKEIQKVLNSAVANAQHNDDQAADELYVSACFADEGPTLKRFRPRARGRAGRIHKQTCHITIVVSRYDDETLDRLRDTAANRGSSASGSSDRRARVAKSRGEAAPADTSAVDETPADEAPAEEELTAAAEAAEDVVESEAVSTTVDSDDDGEVNATDESPYGEGSHALIDGDPDVMPDGFPVKGNSQSMLYHNQDSPFYGRTKAEVWFASDEAAEAAGFSKPESQQKREADAAETTDADDSEGDA
jgi:large subunit ribosomal protein L22